ncbi:glycosyltransferase [Ruegeria atlantica]|uniref:glycosyltransferase n=1 Tax=Ruegeria atlantica TaxID=81569 RepID=UPI00147CC55E|nr:glycosyltransferase [Ruegeria atlantica]
MPEHFARTKLNAAKVMHVIAHMEKGGAERQMMLLTQASRHSHVIAVLKGNEVASDTPVVLLENLNPVKIFSKIQTVIREYSIDIVQLWLPDRITIPAMLAAKSNGCRIISGDRRKVRNYGGGAFRDRLPYINHVVADLVVPNYPHFPPPLSLRRVLGVPRKTKTIVNGLALKAREVPISSHPTRLLFVGRLVEQKRVQPLVEKMPRILAETGIQGLDIVGEGPEEAAIRNSIMTLGLAGNVRLHGRLTDWGECFSPESHMLVLPSASEGMSNTLFEAISWGYFALTSQSRELDALLSRWKHKPVTFDHENLNTLVEQLRITNASPIESIQTRLRSMQCDLLEFSVERMAASYDGIYDQLSLKKATS